MAANNRLMDNLRVDLNVSPDLKRLMEHNPEIAPKATMMGLRAITKEGSKQVKAEIKREGLVLTGKLWKSVKGVTNKNKSFIGTKSRIANILENGATAHLIEPKHAEFLRFKKGGKIVKAKKVNHPGVKKYEWMEITWERMESSGQVETLFSMGVWNAINKIQNGG